MGLGSVPSALNHAFYVQRLEIWGSQFGLLPGKPVVCNYGLLSINSGLLWSIVACCFGLLGFPGGTCVILGTFAAQVRSDLFILGPKPGIIYIL